MKVKIGADHAGIFLKNAISSRLAKTYNIEDVGAYEYDVNDDYPDIALNVCRLITTGEAERGIIICGSGVGACIAANKIPGIRACLCHDHYSAHQGVQHDDMNVICLGAGVVGLELATDLITTFLEASFIPEERFIRRRKKVTAIEKKGTGKT